MKAAAAVLLLALVLPPAALRAGEEATEGAAPPVAEGAAGARAAVPKRLAALRARLTSIHDRIQDLEKRLGELEAAMDREEKADLAALRRRTPPKKPAPTPEPEAETAPPAPQEHPAGEEAPAEPAATPEGEEGMDPAIAAVVGTWELDTEAFFQSFEAMLREQMADQDVPEEVLGTLLSQMKDRLGEFSMTFVFEADLTWSVTGTVSGEEKTASGTWERDGEALTLTQTYEDGEKSDEPQTLEGTYADGVIHLRPAGAEGEMIPFDLVLRKAP